MSADDDGTDEVDNAAAARLRQMRTLHSESTCIITARDFASEPGVTLAGGGRETRYRWTREVMEAIIAALDGHPVTIGVDRNGHTVTNVTLVGTGYTPGYSWPTVIVRYHHGDGCTEGRPLPDGRMQAACPRNCRGYHDTGHWLEHVTVIVPNPKPFGDYGPGYGHKAANALRDARYAELQAARAQVVVNP